MSAAVTMKSTGISYTRDAPNAGEREPLLAQNTDENVKNLSRLQIFRKGAREVADRNTGLLLVVASEAFFASMEAAAKILQKVEPPVTIFQVRLKSQYLPLVQCSNFVTQAHDHSDDSYLHRLYDIHVRTLEDCYASYSYPLNRFIAKIPDPFIGPKGVRILLLMRGIGGCAFSIEHPYSHHLFMHPAPLGYLGYTTPFNIYLSQTLLS